MQKWPKSLKHITLTVITFLYIVAEVLVSLAIWHSPSAVLRKLTDMTFTAMRYKYVRQYFKMVSQVLQASSPESNKAIISAILPVKESTITCYYVY